MSVSAWAGRKAAWVRTSVDRARALRRCVERSSGVLRDGEECIEQLRKDPGPASTTQAVIRHAYGLLAYAGDQRSGPRRRGSHVVCVDDVGITSRRGEACRYGMNGMALETEPGAQHADLDAGRLALAARFGAERHEARVDERCERSCQLDRVPLTAPEQTFGTERSRGDVSDAHACVSRDLG